MCCFHQWWHLWLSHSSLLTIQASFFLKQPSTFVSAGLKDNTFSLHLIVGVTTVSNARHSHLWNWISKISLSVKVASLSTAIMDIDFQKDSYIWGTEVVSCNCEIKMWRVAKETFCKSLGIPNGSNSGEKFFEGTAIVGHGIERKYTHVYIKTYTACIHIPYL